MRQENYFISVGEPWGFSSPDGQNIINGVIVKVLSATCLVFKANYVLDFKGVKGVFFVLCPRHFDNSFDDLKNGKNYVTVNGNILPEEYDDEMDEDYLMKKSKFVIIGSVRI